MALIASGKRSAEPQCHHWHMTGEGPGVQAKLSAGYACGTSSSIGNMAGQMISSRLSIRREIERKAPCTKEQCE